MSTQKEAILEAHWWPLCVIIFSEFSNLILCHIHHIISRSLDKITDHDHQTCAETTKIFLSNSQVVETKREYYSNYGILFGVTIIFYRASLIEKCEIWLNCGNNRCWLWYFRNLLIFLYFLMYNMCMFEVFIYLPQQHVTLCHKVWLQVTWHVTLYHA